ncbi:MAG: hybrid sensor histidine kinase/response regulator [Polyangiaceae bacterium]|nr:hybrid sensor histidine kinase/response regulator [Polyangiaceae bacterium]
MSSALVGDNPEAKARLLEILLSATQDGIVDWDLVTGETSYNARFSHLLGFDGEEHREYCASADAWRDLMHHEDSKRALKLIDDHLKQSWPLYTTVRMRHRYGGYRHIMVRGAAQRDENDCPLRMVLIFSDIDERIRGEERQRALVSALPDTLFRVRSDGMILSVKNGVERQGSPFVALREGLTLSETIADKRLRARLEAALVQPRELAQAAETLGVTSTSNDGSQLHHEVRIVRSGEDELVCIVRDVTERRGLEDQLLQSQKLGAIGQLAAGVAHEINTPMQFIGDNLHFAQAAIGDVLHLLDMLRAAVTEAASEKPSAEKLAELAQAEVDLDFEYAREALPTVIERSLGGVERVTKIVRAMKAFAHPESDRLTPTDLRSLIESTVMVATNEWKYVADVELSLDASLPQVPCIGGELNQVILNLVINASHAVADVVGSSGNKGKISISAQCSDTHAEIRVRDTGTGIPEHARSRVFEPFFTTKEVGKGTGQGLAMAYNCIVKRHRGTIDFETELGLGTTFVIRLPLSVESTRSGLPV